MNLIKSFVLICSLTFASIGTVFADDATISIPVWTLSSTNRMVTISLENLEMNKNYILGCNVKDSFLDGGTIKITGPYKYIVLSGNPLKKGTDTVNLSGPQSGKEGYYNSLALLNVKKSQPSDVITIELVDYEHGTQGVNDEDQSITSEWSSFFSTNSESLCFFQEVTNEEWNQSTTKIRIR